MNFLLKLSKNIKLFWILRNTDKHYNLVILKSLSLIVTKIADVPNDWYNAIIMTNGYLPDFYMEWTWIIRVLDIIFIIIRLFELKYKTLKLSILHKSYASNRFVLIFEITKVLKFWGHMSGGYRHEHFSTNGNQIPAMKNLAQRRSYQSSV